MEALKAAGSVIAGLAIFAALVFIGVVFILGAETVSERALPFFSTATVLAIVFCVVILLPLSILRATRIVSVWGFFIASYVVGVYIWMFSFLITYSLWGAGAVFIGLCFVGIGILPLAIIAVVTQGLWSAVVNLLLGIVILYGTRIFAIYLAASFENAEASVTGAVNQSSFVKVARLLFVTLIIVSIIFVAAHNIIVRIASRNYGSYLSIIGVPTEKDAQIVMGNSWTIYLDGIIDAAAAKRFEDYVASNHVPAYSYVILNSPGGNLMQGIELGRSFRAHDFRTAVGKAKIRSTHL